jgi:hypothetical protein
LRETSAHALPTERESLGLEGRCSLPVAGGENFEPMLFSFWAAHALSLADRCTALGLR